MLGARVLSGQLCEGTTELVPAKFKKRPPQRSLPLGDHRHEPLLWWGDPRWVCGHHAGPCVLPAHRLWAALLCVMSQALHILHRVSVCETWCLVTTVVGQGPTPSFVELAVPSRKPRIPCTCDGEVCLDQRALPVTPTLPRQSREASSLSAI